MAYLVNATTEFPFFDLPRRARDVIYDQLLAQDRGLRSLDTRNYSPITVRHSFDPFLFSVGRQFAAELEERVEQKTSVHLTKAAPENGSFHLPPALLTHARRLHISIPLRCASPPWEPHRVVACQVRKDLAVYRQRYIEKLMEDFRHPLLELSVNVYVVSDTQTRCRSAWFAECSQLASLPAPTTMELWYCRYAPERGNRERLLMRYSDEEDGIVRFPRMTEEGRKGEKRVEGYQAMRCDG